MEQRFSQILDFIIEIDKLKTICRQSYIIDGSKRENDAEHSWHLAMMAILFQEYSNEKIDILRVIKMVLIHDIIEIDAGDTFAYDKEGYESKEERELIAAERIFNILPKDIAQEIRLIWDEFEENKTPESKFANAIDRLHPLILNYYSGGMTWEKHNINKNQIIERNQKIDFGSHKLWDFAKKLLRKAIEEGYVTEK